ncbi:MAG: hypothetical protein OEY93_03290 [Anaerolineae bacterium]|nr:hypothetical protein [Anaerolineae bacterium]
MDWKKFAGKFLPAVIILAVVVGAGLAVYNYGYHRGFAAAHNVDPSIPHFIGREDGRMNGYGKVFGYGKGIQPRDYARKSTVQHPFPGYARLSSRLFHLPYLEIAAFLAVAAAFGWMFGSLPRERRSPLPETPVKEKETAPKKK